MPKKKAPTKAKAKKNDRKVRGKPLTERQRRFWRLATPKRRRR